MDSDVSSIRSAIESHERAAGGAATTAAVVSLVTSASLRDTGS